MISFMKGDYKLYFTNLSTSIIWKEIPTLSLCMLDQFKWLHWKMWEYNLYLNIFQMENNIQMLQSWD